MYLKELCSYILNPTINFYHHSELEQIRASLLSNDNLIKIIDLGAGSSYSNSDHKKISVVAKEQLSNSYQLQVISRLISYTKSEHCIELGSSLGLSSLYMAKSTSGKVSSFEGNKAFIDLINYQKKLLNVKNLDLIEGNFDDTLDMYLNSNDLIDFAFIDGNHRKQATIEYYNKIKEKCTEDAILIFDDIYWSKGMMEAWEHIKSDKDSISSIDLYFMGIVFLNKNITPQQHVKIRPKKWF